MKKYKDLTDDEKVKYGFNGCGSSKSFWGKFVPDFIFRDECNHHDYNYFLGGNEFDKDKADYQFHTAMMNKASKCIFGIRHILYGIAGLYYKAVSKYPSKRSFNYNEKTNKK